MISPVLMNVALHGMEEAAGVRYITTGSNAGTARPGSPVLIRYAGDALALRHSRGQAEQVKARLAAWLAPRGLVFNEDKTRIVHLDEGLDFLGFNVRRYRGKLLIKPSKAAVKRIKARLTAEMKALRGHNAQMVLIRLNPVIRGWSAYYRHCVSSQVFDALDDHMWKLTYKWANWSHPHKGKRWIVRKYFGRFVPSRRDRWVFGDRDSGAYLLKFAWTKITRHTLIKGWASPDDPALTSYWAARRRRGTPRSTRPGCGYSNGSEGAARSAGNCCSTPTRSHNTQTNGNSGSKPSARRPVTRRSPPARDPGPKADPPCSASSTPAADAASQTAPMVDQHFCTDLHAFRARPSRLPGKRAWPVPRGRRRSNAPPLPDWRIWFFVLEAAGLAVQLVNAAQARNLPGRPKTDLLTELPDVSTAQETGCPCGRSSGCPKDPDRQAAAAMSPA